MRIVDFDLPSLTEANQEREVARAAEENASESAEIDIEGLTTMVNAFVNQRWIRTMRRLFAS